MGFCFRIRIIIAKVAGPTNSFGGLEIYPHRLDMANVEIAIGLWRKSESQFPLGDLQMFFGCFWIIAFLIQEPGLNIFQLVPKLIGNPFFGRITFLFDLFDDLSTLLIDKLAI